MKGRKKAKQVDRTQVLLKYSEVPLSGLFPDVRCEANALSWKNEVLGAHIWEGGICFQVSTLTQVGQASSMT